jgi:hypothetical protein
LGALGLYNLAHGKIQQIKDDIGKAKGYKEMMNVNPSLGEQGADSKLVQRHYDTLYKFNPDYAKDPMVAGAYVSQSLEMAQPNLGILNELVGARRNHLSSQHMERETPATKKFVKMVAGGASGLADMGNE